MTFYFEIFGSKTLTNTNSYHTLKHIFENSNIKEVKKRTKFGDLAYFSSQDLSQGTPFKDNFSKPLKPPNGQKVNAPWVKIMIIINEKVLLENLVKKVLKKRKKSFVFYNNQGKKPNKMKFLVISYIFKSKILFVKHILSSYH